MSAFGLKFGTPSLPRPGVVSCLLRHPGASALPLAPPELAGVASVAASVQIYRYPIAAISRALSSPRPMLVHQLASCCGDSQDSRCLLQGLVEEDGQWTDHSHLGQRIRKPRSPCFLFWGSELCFLCTEACLLVLRLLELNVQPWTCPVGLCMEETEKGKRY